jgi:hypothetical protein
MIDDEIDDPIENENGTNNYGEDEQTLNGNKCHLCLEQMNSKDELYDHMERYHEDFYNGILEAARSMNQGVSLAHCLAGLAIVICFNTVFDMNI